MNNSKSKPFFITTAIAYPNSKMHVGFGWEVIGSDMIARYHRMQGKDVFFSTGTDEHSQNVEKAATAAGATAKAYCDQMALEIKESMERMDIAYDRFIRTSDADHEKVCQYLITKAHEQGDVYKQAYEGLYCESCEVFYTEKETTASNKGPVCTVHKFPLKKVAEENYFFKLSKYENELKKLFQDQPDFLAPENRRNEVVSFLEGGLKDFSVSRTSFKWGIPLPFDPKHIIYVWYDALINYLSAIDFPVMGADGEVKLGNPDFFEKFWPCDVHVIGKDITRFHCIYWPAMLMSAKIPLPKRVWAHGFINLNGEKMSKTRGNIVTPDEVMKDFGTTALRWYLLSANSFASDGNYSDEDIVLKCNAELSNNIGNLVNRVGNMALKYFPDGILNAYSKSPIGVESVEARMLENLGARAEKLAGTLEGRELGISAYVEKVVHFSFAMNKYVDETKPWALAKAGEMDTLATVLYELLEGIRNLAVALWPIVPDASVKILDQLGVQSTHLKPGKTRSGKSLQIPDWKRLSFEKNTTFSLKTPQPLFPRLELAKRAP